MFPKGGQNQETLFPSHASQGWANQETLIPSHVSQRWGTSVTVYACERYDRLFTRHLGLIFTELDPNSDLLILLSFYQLHTENIDYSNYK